MSKISLAFFTVAPIYLLIGMAGGIYMSVTHDHAASGAHAHLNLLGFVVMAVMGTFYELAKDKVSNLAAWANFYVSNLAVILMVPALAIMLITQKQGVLIPLISAGSIFAVLGLLIFLSQVLRVRKLSD